jgi:gas vesicle protein
MTDKLCTGCNLNHIHNDARPIILTHNKKPFQDYATLETEVKRLMLAPGQAAIGYYVDPTAEDGLSSVIVVGSLESGCFPEIFKSAHQIDDLVDYFNRLIETQTSDMQQLGEDLREQIINEVTILNNTTIQELKTIMNSSLSEQNARFIVEMDDFKDDVNQRLDASITDVITRLNDSVSEINQTIQTVVSTQQQKNEELTQTIQDTKEEINEHIDSSVESINQRIDELTSSTSQDADSIRNYIDQEIDTLD